MVVFITITDNAIYLVPASELWLPSFLRFTLRTTHFLKNWKTFSFWTARLSLHIDSHLIKCHRGMPLAPFFHLSNSTHGTTVRRGSELLPRKVENTSQAFPKSTQEWRTQPPEWHQSVPPKSIQRHPQKGFRRPDDRSGIVWCKHAPKYRKSYFDCGTDWKVDVLRARQKKKRFRCEKWNDEGHRIGCDIELRIPISQYGLARDDKFLGCFRTN